MRFLLIDRVISWEPGRSAAAVKNVALSEDFFEEHFPGKPIMPGALVLEGMAQLAGLLLEEALRRDSGRRAKALLTIVERAKFRRPVYPGDQLEYRVQLAAMNELGGQVEATASCGGAPRAECRLTFAFHEFENQRLERRQEEVVSLWRRDLPS
jgi:3-hydroxymyristoyl/3-hydroxydecanoyl-(acyl carrier protein) dehydratase